MKKLSSLITGFLFKGATPIQTIGDQIVTFGKLRLRKRSIVLGVYVVWVIIQSLLFASGKISEASYYKYTFFIFE
jgi:hypothetical protein